MAAVPPFRVLFFWLSFIILVSYFVLTRFFDVVECFYNASGLYSSKITQVKKPKGPSWHAPVSWEVNSLKSAIQGTGTYGFVFDSSTLPEDIPYGNIIFYLFIVPVAYDHLGTYNWCNMPHVRRNEYPIVDSSYDLQYVEVIHRHHKRTPYASNTLPVETYPWHCNDEGLFFYGAPLPVEGANHPANTYWSVYASSSNPLAPRGFSGTCQFPQITREGLDDSWQHGKDLYGVYHDLLGFLPEKYEPDVVTFRVTNNLITSQVASMVISGMFSEKAKTNLPLFIQPDSIDSLEPAYTCPAAERLFSRYGPGSSDPGWTSHLEATSDLFESLDTISNVPSTDPGFHMSFDHYFDNLSSRLCHAKPLPCNAKDPSLCVTRAMADKVFRLGEYEYSYLYRDAGPRTLEYSVARFGIWIAELAQNLRDAMHATDSAGSSNRKRSGIKYRHNVAHDGSVSLVLSILQVEKMVWPGMGSEVVFELYKSSADQQYYVRVLWGGQVLKSSSPTLGVMDMVPIGTVLAYFDELVGHRADKIPGLCDL